MASADDKQSFQVKYSKLDTPSTDTAGESTQSNEMIEILPRLLFQVPKLVDGDLSAEACIPDNYRQCPPQPSQEFICSKCGKNSPVITSQPGQCQNNNESIDFIKNLVALYKKRVGNADVKICSGGIQQFINRQSTKNSSQKHLCEKCALSLSQNKDRIELSDLPVNIKLHIFSYLNAKDLCRGAMVCKEWYDLTSDNLLWGDLLQKNILKWNVIGSSTNPYMYKEVESEWLNKDIYLRCSPEIVKLMRLENQAFHSISSMLKSLLPKKSPKLAMFGPGLESSTKSIVRKLMYEDNSLFSRIGMFPGENGVGAGISLKMHTNQIFHMSVLYSSTKNERQNHGVDRSQRNKLYHEQTDLMPAIRDLCHTLDGFVCVVDATSEANVQSSKGELHAMLNERWSSTHVPLVVLSCVKDCTLKRIPCIEIAKQLDLTDLNRPWQVHDCVVDSLSGIEEGIEWLVEQSQRR